MGDMAHLDRPDIILFFSDQQRWDTCGCYGQPAEVTPNLDAMASEGVRFNMAFTCQPVCGPARACIQTGKYATETGCYTNNRALPLNERTVAHRLSEQGYEVGYLGKWHLASSGHAEGPEDFRTKPVPPERRGGYRDFWLASDVLEFTSHSYDGHMFDSAGARREFSEGRYRVDAQTDWAIEYLRSRSTDRPLFLMVSYIEPHHQNDHNHYEGPTGSKERFADFVVPGDLDGLGGDWREEYPDYLGCINSLDQNLGRVREALDQLGMTDSTLVLYTSDHGTHFRTRNPEYKRSCHDASLRIPLVACGPGFRGGLVKDDLVSLIDLPPTLLAAGGVTPPATMRGAPLQGLLARGGGSTAWREEVYVQISEDHTGRAIRTPRWTYEVWDPSEEPWSGGRRPSCGTYTEYHLYDNEKDPHQRKNLVKDPEYRGIRADLAQRLIERIAQAGEPRPEILPAPSARR